MTTSTERSRRLRSRRRDGIAMSVTLEVHTRALELLRRNALLTEREAGDRLAVTEALVAALEKWGDGYPAKVGWHNL